jgi:hypothetical protein
MKKFKLSRGAVRFTIDGDSARIKGASLPKSGKPKEYTIRQPRALTRYIKNNPKDIYTEVRHAQSLEYSDSTIKRYLRNYNISNWRAKLRPALTEEHAAARLAWCLRHKSMTYEE